MSQEDLSPASQSGDPNSLSVHVRFVVKKATLGKVFFFISSFPRALVSFIHHRRYIISGIASVVKLHINNKCLVNLYAPCILHIGQTYRYSTEYSFYIFSQQIYLIIFFWTFSHQLRLFLHKLSCVSQCYPSWFIKYSHFT